MTKHKRLISTMDSPLSLLPSPALRWSGSRPAKSSSGKKTHPLRSYDPAMIATVRSAEAFAKVGGTPQADGVVAGIRWVPTSKGVALSILDCGGCPTRVMPDGSHLDGPPANIAGSGVIGVSLLGLAFCMT